MYTRDGLKGPQDSHLDEAHSSGAHLGSVDPRIGRTNLRSADPGHPRGVSLLLVPVLWPINIRGGVHFLRTHLTPPLSLLVSKARR
jgi:hypothetical protein